MVTNKTEEFILNYEVNLVDIKYNINANKSIWSWQEQKIHDKASK